MKLKYKFVVEKVNDGVIAAAVGRDNERFHGMIRLNAGGEVLFKLLQEGCSSEELLRRFADRFGITEDTARPSVDSFLEELRQNGLLDEDEYISG